MTTRRFFLVRHGETDWNVAGRLQGRRDVPLNALGREQAARVARVVHQLAGGVAGLAFVSSPLLRAVETMRIVRATLDLPVNDFRVDPRLAEISFGIWEGQTWPQIRQRDGDRARRRDRALWTFSPPGGESYADLAKRAHAAAAELSGDAVLVTHGGVIRALLHVAADMPAEEAALLPVRQGAVYVVEGGHFEVAQ